MSESSTNDQMQKEALSIIDDETNRKIEDIKRHIDFISASLRASANMQTNQLLVAIQQLTVEGFCLEYCGNTQVFLNEQNKKRMNQDSFGRFRKRKSALETNIESPTKKAKPARDNENTEETVQEEQRPLLEAILQKPKKQVQDNQVTETIQEESEEKKEKEQSPEHEEESVEPLAIKLVRDGHTFINIQLEPGKDTEVLGSVDIDALNEEAISKLSETHRSRLWKQIEEIQNKLDILKQNFK